jgi:hypothetical protein
MIWNIALLFLVFGSAKKKIKPQISALIFGAVKGVLYYVVADSILNGVIGFLLFGSLALAVVYLIARLDKKEATDEPYPKYGTRRTGSGFKWEYVPLSIIIIFLIFAEIILQWILG